MPLRLLLTALFILTAVSCAPERVSNWKRGLAYLRLEQYRAAIEPLRRDLERTPEHYEAQCLIGCAHEKLGEFDAALDAYAKTLALNPVNACAFTGTGRIRAAQGRWNEAWGAFAQARSLEANEPLLALYPALRDAAANGALAVAEPAAIPDAAADPRTITVAVRVVPATLTSRQTVTITAAAPSATPFDRAFAALVATFATAEAGRCHDRFFAKGLPAALDARFALPLRPDGTVDAPEADPDEPPSDMRACVQAALYLLKFIAPQR